MATSLKNRLAIGLLCLLAASAAAFGQNVAPELNITLGEQRVKFAPTRSFQEMRLEVVNSVGEIVFTHTTTEAEFDWNLRAANSEALAPGLYRYALTLKFGEDQTRQHTGHFIVEQGQDQIWLTASDGAEVSGTSLNAARSGGRSVAGFRTAEDKSVKREVEGREIVDEKGSKLADAKKATRQEKAALSGTVNKVAKFDATGLAANVIDSAIVETGGNVGIGTTVPNARLSVSANTGTPPSAPGVIGYFSNADGNNTFITADTYGGDNVSNLHSDFLFRRARGTMAAPSAVQTDDIVGQIQMRGYGTTGFATTSRAGIRLTAAENWTNTAQGAYLAFMTNPIGSANINVERMRLTDTGNLGLGVTAPAAKLDVLGDIRSSALRQELIANAPPNIINGFMGTGSGGATPGNRVGTGVVGASISGGGFNGSLIFPGGGTASGDNTNRVTDWFGTVGGGFNNRAGDDSGMTGRFATVGGGNNNIASGYTATVGGGQGNIASGFLATVSGGVNNTASSNEFTTVGGGISNTASGDRSTVGGGSNNTASGGNATVGGGNRHIASGILATVGGGQENIASGNISVVPGGLGNIASGDFSFAAGRRAIANHAGAFVWADSTNVDFASTGINQFLIRATGGVGIGTTTTPSPLTVAGVIESTSGGIKFPDGTTQTTAVTGGNGNFIQNSTALQASSNFNISGNGLIGGALGIGIPNPQGLFHVRNPDGSNFLFTGYPSNAGTQLVAEIKGSSGNGGQLRFSGAPNFVDIGQNAAGDLVLEDRFDAPILTVNGSGDTNNAVQIAGDLRIGTTGANGCLKQFDGTVIAGTCSSDLRFKREITSFPKVLHNLAQLRPVHYYWRGEEFPRKQFGSTQTYGLIAQEVEQTLPELVSEDAQGYKQVDYSKLPLLTLQAVKELKAENDTLKARLATLEQMLQQLTQQTLKAQPKHQ